MDPMHLDTSGSINQSANPVAVKKQLVMGRCDPKSAENDGLSAAPTVVAIKYSVVSFWMSMDNSIPYSVPLDGS